jgi:outer membrane protein TolC
MASIADLQRALDDACQRALEAYFDWLRLQQQLDRAEQRVQEVAALSDRMQRQFAGGKVSEGDAQLAASALIDAQFARDSLRAERDIARTKVETLAGAPVGLPAPWAMPAVSSLDARDLALDEAMVQARLGNGQWRAAQERAEAARIRIGRIAPDYLPKLDLDLRRSVNDRSNPPLSPTTNHAWGVQLTYQIPLGGEIGARRDELSARSRIALAEIDRAEQTVRSDLAAARHRSAQAQAAIEPVARQVRYLQDVVRTSEIQFEAGRRSLLQLIQLRDQRFNAEQRNADNAYRVLTAQSQWLAASGALAIALGVAVPEELASPVRAGER